MKTRVLQADRSEKISAILNEVISVLEQKEVVALPTETVYGLAADALEESAVEKIFVAKERPSTDPLIVHLPHKHFLQKIAAVPDTIYDTVVRLTEIFWPGPLTLILPKTPMVPSQVTAGLDTVAVRMSKHPLFSKIIQKWGRALAAPSANRFGSISPTSAQAVREELDGKIPLIIDGGATSYGMESTIINIEGGEKKPRLHILRPGPITKEELKKYGEVIYENKKENPSSLVAPGMLESHYAPQTPLRLLTSPQEFVSERGKRYALLSYRGNEKEGYMRLTHFEKVAVLSPGSGKLPEAAVRLFFLLRQLDTLGVDEIIAEPVPERGMGVAIMDRLRRASHRC